MHRHGRAILVAAGVWGAAIAVFGFAGHLWLALALLAIAGAADMVSGIFRLTIWNQTIPDHLRGRLAGIELLSYSTGPLPRQYRTVLGKIARYALPRRAERDAELARTARSLQALPLHPDAPAAPQPVRLAG